MRQIRARRAGLIALGSLLIVLAVAALGLMLLVRDFVRQTIVPPLDYLLWLAGLALRSVPQSAYWALVVAVVVVVALRSLAAGRAQAPAASLSAGQTPFISAREPVLTLLEQRVEQIAHLETSAFAREKIAFELRGLLLQVLAFRERQSALEIERRIRSGALDVPPGVRNLVVDWQTWLHGVQPAPAAGRWLAMLRLPLRGEKDKRRRGEGESEGSEGLIAVIAYLESLLGIISLEEEHIG